MPATFKHSGDMGDVIYALPAVRALGGGILYLDPAGGLSSPLVKWRGRDHTKMSGKTIDAAASVLLLQPYIQEVRHWSGEPVDFDLDQFRLHVRFNNLADSHLSAFNLPFAERDQAWLTVDEPLRIPDHPIVIARNFRYHGNDSFWESNLPLFKDRAVFVGHPKEHDVFVYTFGHEVTYFPTPDLLALTRVLAGCDQFMGNEGLPRAIAEGLKINVINEYGRLCPNTIFQRPGAQYV